MQKVHLKIHFDKYEDMEKKTNSKVTFWFEKNSTQISDVMIGILLNQQAIVFAKPVGELLSFLKQFVTGAELVIETSMVDHRDPEAMRIEDPMLRHFLNVKKKYVDELEAERKKNASPETLRPIINQIAIFEEVIGHYRISKGDKESAFNHFLNQASLLVEISRFKEGLKAYKKAFPLTADVLLKRIIAKAIKKLKIKLKAKLRNNSGNL
jgi:hypothetical protein